MHTDRYLDFQSHKPSHVKTDWSGVCMTEWGASPPGMQDNLQKKECHLTKVFKQNGYLSAFICSSSLPSGRDVESIKAPPLGVGRIPSLVMLLYMEGVSEDIRWACRKFGIKVVFRSGWSLCFMLTKVKDTLTMEKLSKVVYRVPCSCGRAYIGETVRRHETRMKEHWNACQKGVLENSTLAEYLIKVGGDHSGWPGQEPQGAVAEGGNPHPVAHPPQQQWETGVAWMLDGCPERQGMQGQPEVTHHFWWHTTPLLVTANDEMHGYKWQVLTLAALLSPWRRPEHLVETSAWFQLCCEAGIGEPAPSHAWASWEALTSKFTKVVYTNC